MKVIGPLFLNGLRDDFELARDSRTKLRRLLARLHQIKFFDPACGSGNFLIIAYKEIRRLEMEIIAALEALGGKQRELYLSQIRLEQFYGVELDDFAHEVTMLSLWLAEHQMNLAFQERFNRVQPYLPLKESGHIVCANAARVDWDKVCPVGNDDEVYVMGNPPYMGAQTQGEDQKDDLDAALIHVDDRRRLDYVAIWLIKAADYLRNRPTMRAAFVATSSITQGQQVGYLWPHVLRDGVEIGFAYRPFKWGNSAKGNAAVSVVIIGLWNASDAQRWLFDGGRRARADHINPYLVDGPDTIVSRSRRVLSDLPEMCFGNMPIDYGHLILSDQEKTELLDVWPEAQPLVRPLLGADELLYGRPRWCLWIEDGQLEVAMAIPPIKERINAVRECRAKSSRASTREAAKTPYQFDIRNMTSPGRRSVVVPRHTSERRDYVPLGLVSEDVVVHDSASVIYDADLWAFGVVSSRMHMVWVRAIAGRLEDRLRYASTVCYNTFPFPSVGQAQRRTIEQAARGVISAREQHSEKTLADLYDPDQMPSNLRAAHRDLDQAVEQCYRNKAFTSDEERLEVLLERYDAMVHAEGTEYA